MKSDKIVDATGLSCPMPIVKTKKSIDELQSGQILEVRVTDPGAKNDFVGWTNTTGHELVDQKEENGVIKFWIKKH